MAVVPPYADGRSDIFAFGCILYELVTGRRAFDAPDSASLIAAILKEEPPELAETARNVPPALERTVRHCLEKNPAQRFQSAGDLAFNLESLTDASVVGKTGAQTAGMKGWSQVIPTFATLILHNEITAGSINLY